MIYVYAEVSQTIFLFLRFQSNTLTDTLVYKKCWTAWHAALILELTNNNSRKDFKYLIVYFNPKTKYYKLSMRWIERVNEWINISQNIVNNNVWTKQFHAYVWLTSMFLYIDAIDAIFIQVRMTNSVISSWVRCFVDFKLQWNPTILSRPAESSILKIWWVLLLSSIIFPLVALLTLVVRFSIVSRFIRFHLYFLLL